MKSRGSACFHDTGVSLNWVVAPSDQLPTPAPGLWAAAWWEQDRASRRPKSPTQMRAGTALLSWHRPWAARPACLTLAPLGPSEGADTRTPVPPRPSWAVRGGEGNSSGFAARPTGGPESFSSGKQGPVGQGNGGHRAAKGDSDCYIGWGKVPTWQSLPTPHISTALSQAVHPPECHVPSVTQWHSPRCCSSQSPHVPHSRGARTEVGAQRRAGHRTQIPSGIEPAF